MVRSLSVEVEGPAEPGFSAKRRSYKAASGEFKTPAGAKDATTLYELLEHGCTKYATHNAMGARDFIATHTESKEITRVVDGEKVTQTKEWQYYELGAYKWIKYRDLKVLVEKIGAGLVAHGVKPKSMFSIYSRTSQEWLQTFLGCVTQNITVVTAYDTLGIEGLRSSIQDTDSCGILTDKDNFGTLAKTLKDTPTIKLVVYRDTDGKLNEQEQAKLDEIKNDGITVLSFTELVKAGEKNPVPVTRPTPKDCACIMYTSGSTGKPKGVILNHETVIAGVAGATGVIPCHIVTPKDVFCSLLPLAHIFELTAELSCLVWGASLGYGNPKTASDVSMRNCAGDIRTLKPTIMVAVPALWEAIKKGVVAKVEKESSFKQSLFWKAFALKHKCRKMGVNPPLVDSVVFKKIKEGTGGRLRFLLNGGAALSKDTRIFLDTVVAPCLMGYGLTETNAMAAIMSPEHFDFESTGELTPAVTVRLRDVPEMGYEGKNGQGELMIRGAAVTPGYWKNQEETDKALQDGWFATGDVCEFNENGALLVIDRVKNLVKTLNGEYVALERLEALYRSNKYCANLCVFADSDHAKPVAVVLLNEPAVKTFAQSKGLDCPEHDVASFAQENKDVYNEIIKSIQQTGRECELKPVEILPAVTFSHDEWTPQNGFVTSAQKVQRRKIKEANAKGLEAAFKKT